jgi:hypothetical protein
MKSKLNTVLAATLSLFTIAVPAAATQITTTFTGTVLGSNAFFKGDPFTATYVFDSNYAPSIWAGINPGAQFQSVSLTIDDRTMTVGYQQQGGILSQTEEGFIYAAFEQGNIPLCCNYAYMSFSLLYQQERPFPTSFDPVHIHLTRTYLKIV